MRLWLLCEILLLLCLCTVTCAADGRTPAMRRAHQMRKHDRIAHAKDEPLGQVLAQGSSSPKLSVGARTPGKCTLVSNAKPRAVTSPGSTGRTKFCRPKSVSKTNGTTTGASKSSARTSSSNGGKWLCTFMSLVALTFLYSF